MFSQAHEQEPWFHKGISAHDAIDILERKDNGSFLFRPSSTPGFLSLSYKGVGADNTIHHIRVQIIGNQYLTDGDAKRYDSLSLLVSARGSILVNPVYDPNKPVMPGFPGAARGAAAVAPASVPLSPRAPQRAPQRSGPPQRPGGAIGVGVGAPMPGGPGPARNGRSATGPIAGYGAPAAAAGAPARRQQAPPVAAGGYRTAPAPAAANVLSTSGNGGGDYDESDYSQLTDMGFSREEAFQALQTSNGNIEQALDLLMGGVAPAGTAIGAAAIQPLAAKPSGIVVVAKGDGSGRKQSNGASSTLGLHGVWGVTDDQNQPHKNYMEDGFAVVPVLEQSPAVSYAFFGVYDGHSGREATEFAQDNLHLNLLNALRFGMSPEDAHSHAYQLTDNELLAAGVKTAGCTVVTALISKAGGKRTLHVANAGDGRAVLCKGGKAIRMSFDHKVEVESETKRILALGGTILWGRVQGQTMVSRSLGDHDLKKYVVAEPHYRAEPLDSSCEFLILACDGIWDVSEDQEAVDVVRKAGITDPKAASAALIQHVVTKMTKDNLTAMVIALN